MRGESMKGKSKKSTYSTTFGVDPIFEAWSELVCLSLENLKWGGKIQNISEYPYCEQTRLLLNIYRTMQNLPAPPRGIEPRFGVLEQIEYC